MSLTRITAPAATPVSLAESCAHLRLSVGDDDATVLALIAAAAGRLDGKNGILGRCLINQTWRLTLDAFPCGGLRLPLLPVVSVVVKYTDSGGTEQTLTGYHLKAGDVGVILPGDEGWPAVGPRHDGVVVDFVAGYGDAVAPAPLKQAILLMVGYWYDERSAVNVGNIVREMPLAVDALTAPYRVLTFK